MGQQEGKLSGGGRGGEGRGGGARKEQNRQKRGQPIHATAGARYLVPFALPRASSSFFITAGSFLTSVETAKAAAASSKFPKA